MPKNITPKNHIKISADDMQTMRDALIALTETFPISFSKLIKTYWKINDKKLFNAAVKAIQDCTQYLNIRYPNSS